MIKTDYHIHTNFSIDSDSDIYSMIERAIDIGLEEVAITDHQDYLANGENFPFAIDYTDYILNFNKIKEKYASKINLVLGVEIGLMPHLTDTINKFAKAYPFDFIIGSSHDTKKTSLYDGNLFVNKDKYKAYMEYFYEVLENTRLFDCYCVYGHLDYVNRYGDYKDKSLFYKDYADIIDEILRQIISRGKGIEINTSGYRYGLGHFNPQPDIVKRYKELGGEIITIGSDAHSPQFIAEHFDRAIDYLKTVGFKAHCIFREKKPVFIDIL